MKLVINKQFVIINILVLFVSSNIFAQRIEWGALNISKSRKYSPTIIGEDETKFYTYTTKIEKYVLECFSKKDMKLIYSEEYNISKLNKGITKIEEINFYNNRFIIIASYYEKISKTHKVFAFIVDASNGKLIENHRDIYSIPVDNEWEKGSFDVFVSSNKTKMLVKHKEYNKEKNKLILLDENLDIIVEKEEINNYYEEGYSTFSHMIDNSGSLYFIKSHESKGTYIISYDADMDYEKWEEAIDLSKEGLNIESEITDVVLSLNSKDDIIVTAYYSEYKEELNGCLFLKIDGRSKKIVNTELTELDINFKNQFLTNKQLENKKVPRIKNQFSYIKTINKNDGGIILIGERQLKSKSKIYKDVLFGDIIILNFSSTGKLLWSNRIPKKQVFRYNSGIYPVFQSGNSIVPFGFVVWLITIPLKIPEYFSYLASADSNNVYVFLNDNVKNMLDTNDVKKTAPFRKLHKSVVNLYTINLETGEKTKKVFNEAKDSDIHLKPFGFSQKTKKSDLIMFGMKGRKYKYGKLKL